MTAEHRFLGIDVGATTLKLALEDEGGTLIAQDQDRHGGRAADELEARLARFEAQHGVTPGDTRVFVTGSGGLALAPLVGARFVHEVTAVTALVERRFPDVGTIIDSRRPARGHRGLQARPGGWIGAQGRLDERQVRGRDGGGHRQDRPEARRRGTGTGRPCLRRRPAAQRRGKVRCLRRDRHQQPAEDGDRPLGADGLAHRRHRHAEPRGARPRPDALPAGAAGRRPRVAHSGRR